MKQAPPSEKILFVDDEAEVLNSFRRGLRGRFVMQTALSGEEGLAKLAKEGPFAVVVSDLKMPGMDGISFLGKVRQADPDTVRIMLTGYADVNSAIKAVNEGYLFRFLTKPCQTEDLIKALVAGIRQYRLVRSERELLDTTLQGSIKVLTDLIGFTNPVAFGRASRLSRYVEDVASEMAYQEPWTLKAAAMLSQIGLATMPENLVKRLLREGPATAQERKMLQEHPAIAADLVSAIPRMEEVSRIIAYQEKGFDGSGPPEGEVQGDAIPLGARILKVLLDFDARTSAGKYKGTALGEMKSESKAYDPLVLKALEKALGVEAKYDLRGVMVDGLRDDMLLAGDVMSLTGEKRLLAKGQQLSKTLIMSIRNFHRAIGVVEPIEVLVPLPKV